MFCQSNSYNFARQQGIRAYSEGKTALDCPYQDGEMRFDAWHDGFFVAREHLVDLIRDKEATVL